MKKYSAIFCFLLATVFVGVPSFFAFAGEQGTLGDSPRRVCRHLPPTAAKSAQYKWRRALPGWGTICFAS